MTQFALVASWLIAVFALLIAYGYRRALIRATARNSALSRPVTHLRNGPARFDLPPPRRGVPVDPPPPGSPLHRNIGE